MLRPSPLCNPTSVYMRSLMLQLALLHATSSATPPEYDVAVYGATPAGIMAAVAAARMHRSVVLLAADTHVGGMVTG